MRIKLVIRLLALISIFYSCGEPGKEMNEKKVDSFISEYQNVDFLEFKDSFVAIRQKKGKDIIYIIQNISKNLPVYMVTYDQIRNQVVKIDRTALIKMNVTDYYSEEEIDRLIDDFRKYDFALIQVDSNDNVFINPWVVGAPAQLLRIREVAQEDTIKKGYVYKKYKDNWYIKN